MSTFELITAALLLVLGLGTTQLLGDLVEAFRGRQRLRFHWIPMAWAAIVFAWQMQFLWGVFELRDLVAVWTAARFALLLGMALLLFAAGALVVARPSDDESAEAWEQFAQDGRFALAGLSAFFFLAFLGNPVLFGVSPLQPANLVDLALCVLLVLALPLRSRTAWAVATVLFLAGTALAIPLLSPVAYR